jgi:hypothetical protein
MSVCYDQKSGEYTFECPHCQLIIAVERNAVNCSIFRHGYYFVKNGNNIQLTSQVNPHASKEECDILSNSGKIYGCGKPFRMVLKNNVYTVEKCDYI